jgi:hypothetical protein
VTPTTEPQLAGGQAADLIAALVARRVNGVVALVGHESGISELLAALVGGSAKRMPFKKGGAALVAMDGASGRGQLIWFLPPCLAERTRGRLTSGPGPAVSNKWEVPGRLVVRDARRRRRRAARWPSARAGAALCASASGRTLASRS